MLDWLKKSAAPKDWQTIASPLADRANPFLDQHPDKPNLPRKFADSGLASKATANSGAQASLASGSGVSGKKSNPNRVDSSTFAHSQKFKRSRQSKDSTLSSPEFPWGVMVTQVGQEIGGTLSQVMEQLDNISLLYPQAAQSIAIAMEGIENAKHAAMVAQKFVHLRADTTPQAGELLDLRDVVNEMIEQRRAWISKRGIKARAGMVSAHVLADPAALFSLTDELANWAGSLSQEIGFGIEIEPKTNRARLLVFARIDPATMLRESWENVGWFLWRQLARTMGAKSQLRVLKDALSVSVTFPVPPALPEPEKAIVASDLAVDAELAQIIHGCKVVVITQDEALRETAFRALQHLRLEIKTSWSVDAARDALGNSIPNAVVYDARLDAGKIMQMRNDFSKIGNVAFIELSDTGSEQFEVTSLGTMTTAHVYVPAIAQSLAPALVFELCKII